MKPATVVTDAGKIIAVHDGIVDLDDASDVEHVGDDILMPGRVLNQMSYIFHKRSYLKTVYFLTFYKKGKVVQIKSNVYH